MMDSQMPDFPSFTEHQVQHDRGNLYVLDAGHWPQIDAAADVAHIMVSTH
jgi:hypothetical protein